jgi:hypothetical protein
VKNFCRHAGILFATLTIVSLLRSSAIADEQLVPLSELGANKYRGEEGGLYGGGQNEPPDFLRDAAKKAISEIQPLDFDGNPSTDGKIALLSIGMSNTTQEFSAFMRLAGRDQRKRPELILVDGAQGGADAATWVSGQGRRRRANADPWSIVESRLKSAGVTAAQVQAVWIKQALAGPARYGEFPGHVEALAGMLEKIVVQAKQRYPNLRIVFLSSRIYGGYATTRLNPEPYAYEGAFAVRSVILRQMDGEKNRTGNRTRRESSAPVLVWGPYLWAAGTVPRKADGLVWDRGDLREDGTHPSEKGRRKVAEQLLTFFTNDDLGKAVYLR